MLKNPNEIQTCIQNDPVYFFDHILSCPYYDKQAEIVRAVFKYPRVAVAGCNGPGKTYIVARSALAFLYGFKNSIVITTAPTFRQVENVLWREIRQAFNKSKVPLGGRMLKTKLDLDEKWYALGVSSDKSDNVQGFHAESVLIIADEAAGIDPSVLQEAIEGALTSENVRIVYIGNPTIGYGPFYDAFKDPLFHKIKLSAFDTPNFQANNIKSVDDLKKFKTIDEVKKLKIVNPHLITPLWAWGRLQAWGEDTPMFQARVCAEFPDESSDTLIPLNLVNKAINKEYDPNKWKLRDRINVIGIDVARFGDDTTVMTAMDNYKQLDVSWHNGKNLMETVGHAISLMKSVGFEKENTKFIIDDTGLGGGVTDRLLELGYEVVGINFGSKSTFPDDYANLKAEIFWHVRQLFRDGEIRILDKGKTVGELPTIRYGYTSNGKLEIMSKAKMKKEGFKSPDFADSLALACWGVKGAFTFRDFNVKSTVDGGIGGNLYNTQF